MSAPRSLLLVPGHDPAAWDAALASDADAIVVDLGETVPLAAKGDAREFARRRLDRAGAGPRRTSVIIRINHLSSGFAEADLDAVMGGAPEAVVLPRTVGGRDLQQLAARLAVREAEWRLEDRSTGIIALAADTAAGVLALGTLAGASPRLIGLGWTSETLRQDLGAEAPADGGSETERLARSLVLLAAASADVDAIDASSLVEGRKSDCETARQDGFVARMTMDAGAVPLINAAFTPTPESLRQARIVVDRFAHRPEANIVEDQGRLVERSRLARARRTLARGNRTPGP